MFVSWIDNLGFCKERKNSKNSNLSLIKKTEIIKSKTCRKPCVICFQQQKSDN